LWNFKRKVFSETEEFLSEQSFDKSIFEADGNLENKFIIDFGELSFIDYQLSFMLYQLSFISSEKGKTST